MSQKDHGKMPQGKDLIYLFLGVLGIGTSGPLIADSKMGVPILVFWRNLGGTLLIAPNVPCVDRYFEPGKHFVAFSTENEAIDKIEYYLKNFFFLQILEDYINKYLFHFYL